MFHMISSKYHLYKCKAQLFTIENVVSLTGLSKNSARNLINQLSTEGLIKTQIDKTDRRKHQYSLQWSYIAEKLKNPDEEFDFIVQMLGLEDWDGKYVAMKNFEVIDSDPSVTKLTLRLWNILPNEDIVIIPSGQPEEIFTIEFI